MIRARSALPAVAGLVCAGFLTVSPAASAAAAHRYRNCTDLHRAYPHGVGRSGARDHVTGRSKPVTNFTRNTAVYNANTRSDRDHDGIACEQH